MGKARRRKRRRLLEEQKKQGLVATDPAPGPEGPAVQAEGDGTASPRTVPVVKEQRTDSHDSDQTHDASWKKKAKALLAKLRKLRARAAAAAQPGTTLTPADAAKRSSQLAKFERKHPQVVALMDGTPVPDGMASTTPRLRGEKRKRASGKQPPATKPVAAPPAAPVSVAGPAKDANVVPEVTEYPFEVTDDDHCETPQVAYRHLSPVLTRLAHQLGTTCDALRVYDPYFCAGGVRDRLAQSGFPSVYNKCEDFYARVAANDVPDYDVLVTNPPYSGDNVEKLLQFCKQSNKPFALLMPNYVYMKEYFRRLFPTGVWFLVPKKRYVYLPPVGVRQKKASDTQKKTSPFVSMWYIHLGKPHDEAVVKWWRNHCIGEGLGAGAGAGTGAGAGAGANDQGGTPLGAGVCLARGVTQLPLAAMDSNDPARRRERDRQRRNKRKRKKK